MALPSLGSRVRTGPLMPVKAGMAHIFAFDTRATFRKSTWACPSNCLSTNSSSDLSLPYTYFAACLATCMFVERISSLSGWLLNFLLHLFAAGRYEQPVLRDRQGKIAVRGAECSRYEQRSVRGKKRWGVGCHRHDEPAHVVQRLADLFVIHQCRQRIHLPTCHVVGILLLDELFERRRIVGLPLVGICLTDLRKVSFPVVIQYFSQSVHIFRHPRHQSDEEQ
ncbi:MAG: hypothetical protein JWP25_5299 [Bradyrhizobium sp.]|jgi:hypothetical protein|nr:hypothetical protein [Bradyrhizobium sp.]